MQTDDQIKQMVQDKYAHIALQNKEINATSCCGSGSCTTEVYNIMTDDYSSIAGYNEDADLKLGCGLPTEFAKIKQGDTVIDLGSGAGNDVFIARNETGEKGKVIGIDFTPQMIERARINAEIRGYNNIEFRLGDIEKMPVSADTADVIISNCVLNLVPNKQGVISEIFRVLKPGGHFSISDIVLEGTLPVQIKQAAEMYAGCVSGAILKDNYIELIKANGFINVTIQKDKPINIPDDILIKYLSVNEIDTFKRSNKTIRSITVYAEKPVIINQDCCGPECCN